MLHPRFWNTIRVFICIISTWKTVKTTDFISLISSPDGDFCITNSSSAMFYTTTNNDIGTDESSYYPRSGGICNFGDSKSGTCIDDFEVDNWKSIERNTLILDDRWEVLPVILMPFKITRSRKEKLLTTTLYKWNKIEDQFKISMSLRGQEAHLLLCDSVELKEANCYWFALQGWSQTYTGLRRCNKGDITRIYPDGECEKRKKEKKHPNYPLYMNEKSWTHIIIERNGLDLYLKRYNNGKEEIILHYLEDDNRMFKIKYLLGHRKDVETFCKMHNNYFMQSTSVSDSTFTKYFEGVEKNRVCISLLVNTCPYCLISVHFMDDQNIAIFKTPPIQPTNGAWENHKIMKDFQREVKFIRIKIEIFLMDGYDKTRNEFWYFDNIRTCYKEEYRITQKDNRRFLECRLLKNDQRVRTDEDINYVPDVETSCPSASSLGSPCISCSILEERTSCRSLKICENLINSNKCYCSPGYTGTQCNKECQIGTYGYHCEKNCGFCKPEGRCNFIDGSCKCEDSFEGLTCHMPKRGQYLKHAPKVTDNKSNSCEIQWNASDFVGNPEPKYYLIQYMDPTDKNSIWKDYEEVKKIEEVHEKVVIGDLDSSRMYLIRVLLSDQPETIEELTFQKLPATICNTTCNGWISEDIDIQTTSDSVTIELKLSKDKCDVKSYKYELMKTQGEKIIDGTVSSKWTLPNLISFTNYTIEFSSESQMISREFTTQEGVPSQVREIKMEESTATYIKFSWKKPNYANGIIENYKIEYQRLRRISCDTINPDKLEEVYTPDTSIALNNLEPYSVYRIEVYALNRLRSSNSSGVELETQRLYDFKNDEDLEQIQIINETFERSASFKLENIQCDKLQGPLMFKAEYRCISDWCSNKTEQSDMSLSFQNALDLKSLQAFCEYKCDISFCRDRSNCKLWKSGTFSTKASVPTMLRDFMVIATAKDLISLRWLPPYPPTGTIKEYKIITKCINCESEDESVRYADPRKCSIWPQYYCYKIMDHVYHKKTHSVEIDAMHEEVSKFSRVAYETNILVEEQEPEKPYNISSILNPDNTITLSWNHPNRTNGILKNFSIEITQNQNAQKIYSYRVDEEKLLYSYSISDPLPAATDIFIRIKAYNNEFGSADAEIKESSYPAKPDFTNYQMSISNYTETTITLSLDLTQVEVNNSEVGQYSFVLIDDNTSDNKDPNLIILEKIMNLTFGETSQLRVVAEINLKKLSTNVINFTIGDSARVREQEVLEVSTISKPLQKARYYNITIIMLNEYKGKYRHTSNTILASTEGIPLGKRGEEGSANIAYVSLLLLVLIPIIIGVIIKRKNIVFSRPRISLEKRLDSSSRILPAIEDIDVTIPLDTKEVVVKAPKTVVNIRPKSSIRKTTFPPNPSITLYSKPVKIADFEEYVKTSIGSGELERQHNLFPRGQTQPWQYGSNKINKPKNRYNNLVAYDHSRVILDKIDGDGNSDYINANYIHGYNIERAYIATQGPKSTTLTDFWRMMWQENVRHIVMLANIYEGGKKKVEQYWPNINEELTFGDVVVQYQSMEVFANFEYRTFHVTKGDETRKIEQLHYSTWPDHGVPLYSQSLVPFLRKLLKIPLSSTSPIVVHCSAGVGRTGTILLADISLRMAAKQGVVDMLNILQKLREQRPNMVDNIEQYKLAHLVVLESMMGLRTSIPCNEDMDKAVQKLILNEDYKIQMNYLVETEWQDQAMKSVVESNEELVSFPEKNRFQEIIPESQSQIMLSRYPVDDQSSSYINAVQVDGFRSPGRFFVTQQPLPNTVGDFWRFVAERQINVIISLNETDPDERTCCDFWPTEDDPELQPVDFLLVKFRNASKLEYYDIFTLQVWIGNKHEKEHLDVEIVAFKRWPAKASVPLCCEEFLSFYEEVDAISRRSSNVIVTCFDGATASGAYVALCFIIEQMKLEHECDVCLAVRTIRHNRKQFVTDENQFLFLYECAVKFINGFQSYANFQNQ